MSGGRKTQKKVKRHFLERLESVNGNCYKRTVWTGEWASMPMGKYTNTNTNTNTNTITNTNPVKKSVGNYKYKYKYKSRKGLL